MPMSNEQKAAIGLRYINALKERIATRTKAQERATKTSQWADVDDEAPPAIIAALSKFAGKAAKRYRMTAAIESTKTTTQYLHGEHRINGLSIAFADGAKLELPMTLVPGFAEAVAAVEKSKHLAKDLCREIEFLHAKMQPSHVAAFQAHASRLWAPASKGEAMPDAMFATVLEDYLAASRPATCRIA